MCVRVCNCVCLPDNHLAGCLTRYCLQNSGKLAITNVLVLGSHRHVRDPILCLAPAFKSYYKLAATVGLSV